MLERALFLKSTIEEWCALEEYKEFRWALPSTDEWDQIRYVIKILHPFLNYTLLLSITSAPTIQTAWGIYNDLFHHIESTQIQLQNKRLPWKVNIRRALPAARNKLDKYYSKTSGPRGLLYNLGCILNPSVKLSAYNFTDASDDWYVIIVIHSD